MIEKPKEKQRQRAPSQRSLATRERILDAAEQLFSEHGFDGASIRDIASKAGVQGALVNHHGGSKEDLFFTVVARRAGVLAEHRLAALEARKTEDEADLRGILSAFIGPFLELTTHSGPQWRAYGRLIAHVSADERWRPISEVCFDPTAQVFTSELSRVLPGASPRQIGAGFVFMVSAILSLSTSTWRIGDLSGSADTDDLMQTLLDYCEAGFRAIGSPG